MEKSDNAFAKFLKESKDSESICMNFVQYYLSKFDLSRAKSVLSGIVDSVEISNLEQTHLNVLFQISDIALKKKNVAIAEWALEILSIIKTDLVGIWVNLGIAKAELGKLTDAKDALLKAISIEPNNAAIWHNLGNVYKKLGEIDESLKAYSKAKQIGGLPDVSGTRNDGIRF